MKIVLITSAIKEELIGLESIDKKKFRSFRFYLNPLGIGKINAVMNLYKIYYKKFYKKKLEIIFLGSCGSYKKISDLFIYSNLFVNYDYASLLKKAKPLESISSLIKTNIGDFLSNFLSYNTFLPKAIVNTTDSITLTSLSEDYFYKLNPDLEKLNLPVVENLELYSIAKFCLIHEIPFTALLSITNRVGKNGSKEWEKNYQTLSIQLTNLLKNYLSLF